MRFPKLIQHQYATGKLGLSTFQKVTEALLESASKGAADSVDKYLQIDKTAWLEKLYQLMHNINAIYGSEYPQP